MKNNLNTKARKLPKLPGVYLMKDINGTVIYVGKAKSLKNRVSSYFSGEQTLKVSAMREKIADIEYIVASSEFEALILENSLIKQHKPHYNILLKDDKGYPFIRIESNRDYPTMTVANRANDDGALYYGPFGGRSASRDLISTLLKVFKLPNCSKKFPKDFGKNRTCLNYHIGNCSGWCMGTRDLAEYNAAMTNIKMILSGKTDALIKELTAKMEREADDLKFEMAALTRDMISAVSGLVNEQRVIATSFADTDVIGFVRSAKACFLVMHYYKGDLRGQDYVLIDDPIENDEEALSFLLREHYALYDRYPKEILIPINPADSAEIAKMFSEKAGHSVKIISPQRGEKMVLIKNANTNAAQICQTEISSTQRRNRALELLKKTLNLDNFPERIEAFDISNLGNEGIVAAMTVHIKARPAKKEYRKFRIRGITEQNDVASVFEAVSRRFSAYSDKDEKFSKLPDLLLIDGGVPQTLAAKSAAEQLGITVPVFGMVKDSKHKTKHLVSPEGETIGISGNVAVFSLIGKIQEETHRFAIDYQKKTRNERLATELSGINGIGKKRAESLLRHFGSVKNIKNASMRELREVLPANVAAEVFEYFTESKEKT